MPCRSVRRVGGDYSQPDGERGVNQPDRYAEGDNGWCLALVEPDGERTFMSFSGVENQWNRQWLARLTVAPGSLLYFSGYQLASPCGELLVEWLEKLQDVTPFIDFGPRIGDIPDALLARIMACRPLVSLNRQEAEIAAERFALIRRDNNTWQAMAGEICRAVDRSSR